MFSKIIVKFKDGDIFLHKSEGNFEHDLLLLSSMIRNNNIANSTENCEMNPEENSIHSIEIFLV